MKSKKRALKVMTEKEKHGKLLSEHKILRFNLSKGGFEASADLVAIEDLVNLYVNDSLYAVFHCLPSQIKELAIGHLLTEGIVSGIKEILEIKVAKRRVRVQLTRELSHQTLKEIQLISTMCGEGRLKPPPRTLRNAYKLKFNRNKFNAEIIFRAMKILNSRASIFRASGGTHAAALLDENGALIAFAEDVGRHNAVDKVVGEAAMKKADFSGLLLASTGRLTSEIVIKTLQMGIPVLASLSAPTDRGIKLAEAFGLTLIGFIRGKRFNLYSSPERIKID